MNQAFLESRKAIEQAREALQRGDHAAALKWGQEAARLAPQSEDPWLILAAVASPRASVDYVKKALAANPESVRARRAMQWATQRLQQAPEPATETAEPGRSTRKPRKRGFNFLIPALLLVVGCITVVVAAVSALRSPALAAILKPTTPQQTLMAPHPQSWAQAELPKPTYTSTVFVPTALPTETPTATSTETSTVPPTVSSEPPMTSEPATTPDASATSGGLQVTIVEDTPTSVYAPPPAAPEPPQEPPSVPAAVSGERWIDVDLSQQRVYAYEGNTLMNSFLVSTGTWQTPTVTGTYKIWIKLRSTTMTGPGYYLPNVPYTMYFYKGYGLHGTYWHNNFGTPMSHGCVNLSVPDSAWLYDFASVGTTVNVHN